MKCCYRNFKFATELFIKKCLEDFWELFKLLELCYNYKLLNPWRHIFEAIKEQRRHSFHSFLVLTVRMKSIFLYIWCSACFYVWTCKIFNQTHVINLFMIFIISVFNQFFMKLLNFFFLHSFWLAHPKYHLVCVLSCSRVSGQN